MKLGRAAVFSILALSLNLFACDLEEPLRGVEGAPVYSAANRCFAVAARASNRFVPQMLSVDDSGEGYRFSYRFPWLASPFYLKASGLGSFLLYDEGGSHLVSDGEALGREAELLSDVLLVDDSYESDAEWVVETLGSERRGWMRLRHLKSGRYLSMSGLVDAPEEAADVLLISREGCAEFPEASVDATGEVERTQFEDGSLFGFVDAHSHVLSNFAFGGGGIFHGAPFHALGVEHALSDCERYHGVDGRKDLFGFGFDNQDNLDPTAFLGILVAGATPNPNHATAGWPEFTDWPNAPGSSTHQVQYYKWIERAYLGGLRLMVLHATSNQVICDLVTGLGVQPVRYDCNDMVAVERIIEEAYELEGYIDAQEGGPGRGWFRIVTSPRDARREILNGKMAVILGIETSNLFDCFLAPTNGFRRCTEEDVLADLEHYYDLGVRGVFPVHKFDNGFSAGDGHKFFIELGNFIHTGYFSNFTTDCDPDINTTFDRGVSSFPGLIQLREDYFSPPQNDLSAWLDDPLGTLLPFFGLLFEPPGTEEVCQAAGLTPLGEFLIEQMMQRGMIPEIDHLPRRAYRRAFEMLEEHDYPAAGTHGLDNGGKLYQLGGVSGGGFGRCHAATASATTDDGFQAKVRLIEDNGGFPARGFSFDLNGFAGARGPRFGPNSGCGDPQENPITYPFESYAGDVVFEEPRVGNRVIDFNTEGLAHVGLVPELIEDVRRDGVSDAELEPLFKSAEGYIRMWEKAERRGQQLQRPREVRPRAYRQR